MRSTRILFSLFCLVFLMSACSTGWMAENEEEEEGNEQALENAPTRVATAFARDEATATDVQWFADGDNFETEFKVNGQVRSAVYGPDGTRLESESVIPASDLMASIKEYIAANYAGYHVKLAEVSTSSEGTVYEVVVVNSEEGDEAMESDEEGDESMEADEEDEDDESMEADEEDEDDEDGEHGEAIELVFDENGNFMSKTEVADGEEDEENERGEEDDDDGEENEGAEESDG